jgi:N-acetyl-gamma-glutamyl-phosphate reductase
VKPRIFIDGHAGTTGLRIRDWLAGRDDLALTEIEESRRKDPAARRACLEAADLAVLCLPDEASAQAAEWVADRDTRLLDASTAFRVAPGWVYGLPELGTEQRQAIGAAKFVSNPGCYPSATTLLLRPLVDAGLFDPATPVTVHALSGYSGGGRQLIEKWEAPDQGLVALPYEVPYKLEDQHKHIPEMTQYAALEHPPQFVPAVGPFACGMRVEIPLHASTLPTEASAKAAWETLEARYRGEAFVSVAPMLAQASTNEFTLDPRVCNDTNRMNLHVFGHEQGHILLVAILDNLGKGASGVAIQNLNLMLGFPEETALPR